ncbi:MAG: dehydrogenase, partial [Planctomycetes bacterium]|nr:dehydrogenase [Planctomycetota bacterium]
EHDLLFAAIRSGDPINNGSYMTGTTMAGIMGPISCYTGREVTLEQAMASDFCYAPKPEACHDQMEPPTRLGPDGSYPVPVPGQTKII